MILSLIYKLSNQFPDFTEMHHLEKALEAFIKVGKKYNIRGKSKQEIIEMYGM